MFNWFTLLLIKWSKSLTKMDLIRLTSVVHKTGLFPSKLPNVFPYCLTNCRSYFGKFCPHRNHPEFIYVKSNGLYQGIDRNYLSPHSPQVAEKWYRFRSWNSLFTEVIEISSSIPVKVFSINLFKLKYTLKYTQFLNNVCWFTSRKGTRSMQLWLSKWPEKWKAMSNPFCMFDDVEYFIFRISYWNSILSTYLRCSKLMFSAFEHRFNWR